MTTSATFRHAESLAGSASTGSRLARTEHPSLRKRLVAALDALARPTPLSRTGHAYYLSFRALSTKG